jgi:metacaspase-1
VLVFTNSSHGSYIADTTGDEPMYDEILCPYDVDANPLTDDELRELFTGLPKGVSLTIISDSCHSGTVTRASVSENLPGIRVPDDRRVRFLSPALRGQPVLDNPWSARPKRQVKHPESKMKEILISGCTDKEYSYDALIGGVYHGAMTYFALQAIRNANYQITYAQLQSRLSFLLDEAQYPQHPQLEGAAANKKKQIFS